MPNATLNPVIGSKNLELLRLVGETVYGPYWQKPMVAYIGMSQRHMVRWSNAEWEVPDLLQDGRYLAVVLKELLELHQEKVNMVMEKVVAALPEGGRPGT
jgi:hypothetical protein